MIEKKRLKELIKEGATIYVKDSYQTYEIAPYLFINVQIINNVLYCGPEIVELENLFETKEQAEWHLEFGNITRTETLKLPTWEEAQDERFYYINNFESLTGIHFFISIYKFTNDFEIYCSHGSKMGDYHIERHFDLRDKKQYLEACRLAKKLFLGEEV